MSNTGDKKIGYSELFTILSERTGLSNYRANLFTKAYSKLLKEKVREGYDLDILTICKVVYASKSYDILSNQEYGVKQQIEDLEEELNWGITKITDTLKEYLKIIRNKLEQGYQVNIKSVGYITPYEDETKTGYHTRFSPVLEKAEVIHIMILDEFGNKGVSKLKSEDIYLRMLSSDKLKQPNISKLGNDFKLKTIDI